MIRPTPQQRAEMAAFIDAKQPGLLDDLGIDRQHRYCSRCDGPGPHTGNGPCPECGCDPPRLS